VATWHYLAGGAVLIGGALLLRKKVDGIAPGSALASKPGALTTSEEARLQQLVPSAQAALRRLQARLLEQGIGTYVGSTARTEAQQAANVSKGVSATNHSWHRVRRAVDLYPLLPTGKPDLQGTQLELFRRMHQEAEKLLWRGLAFNKDGSKRYITTNKGKVWDGGHLEYPEGMTWAQAESAARKGGQLA
jgi:hypothetical protein